MDENEVFTQKIPTVLVFRGLSDAKRRLAYIAGYRSLHSRQAPRPECRERLLGEYVRIAGWDDESVRTMQSAAMTPVH